MSYLVANPEDRFSRDEAHINMDAWTQAVRPTSRCDRTGLSSISWATYLSSLKKKTISKLLPSLKKSKKMGTLFKY